MPLKQQAKGSGEMMNRIYMGLVALMLAQPVLSDSSDQVNLRHAVDSARATLDETTQRMNLLVAEMDAGSLEAMPVEAETSLSESEMQTGPEEQEQSSEAAQGNGSVQRALFTSNIEAREPVDELQEVDVTQERVYFFSELIGLEGQEVWHRWIYQGEVMAEVVFQVGGARWRVHSSKNLIPDWTGEWKVEVVDGSGRVLASQSLAVVSPVISEEPVLETP